MEKRKATNRFQRRRTLKLTAEEDERIIWQAETVGISVSEYMRQDHHHQNGQPNHSVTRRLGSLIKHLFDVAKRAGSPSTLEELVATLQAIRRAVDAQSERR